MVKKKEEVTEDNSENVNIQDNNESVKINVQEIKDDLNDYLKYRIDKEVSLATEKVNKKIINYKNRIIIRRDIFIVILLVICFFLGYHLVNITNIKVDISTKNKVTSVKKEKVQYDEKSDDKIKEYGYLLDDIFVNDDSDYFKDYYSGKLSNEVKLYLSMNRIDLEKVDSEDGAVYIDDNDLKEAYENIFDGEYEAKGFKYGDYDFKYLKAKKMYFADGDFKKVISNNVRKIVDAIENDDSIVITTIEGVKKKDKLYDIDLKEIDDYTGGDILDYEKSLSKVEYEFVKKDGNYKLISVKQK